MDFDPERKGSFVSGSGRLCQISSKWVQNCDRENTDRHTHTHTETHRDHTSDLIICPMLCCSNGTDNNLSTANQTATLLEGHAAWWWWWWWWCQPPLM